MVGMVIVSHSNDLAKGLVDLCKSMVQQDIPIIAAGGTSDGRLGTDATNILEAIQTVNQGDGVAIFIDLGSAVLSSELAIDLLPDNLKDNVKIIDGPLVESCIASSIEISINSSLKRIEEVALLSYDIRKL